MGHRTSYAVTLSFVNESHCLLCLLASIVPYKGFKTADGDIMIGGGNDRLFGIMCDKFGKPEWKTDAKFKTNNVRVQNRLELESLVEKVTQTKTTKEWLEVFEGAGMPYAAINDVKDTLEHEHIKARGMVTEVDHPSCGPMKLVSPPVKFSETKPSIRSPPPTLGQHTDAVLADLGWNKGTIKELRDAGIVA